MFVKRNEFISKYAKKCKRVNENVYIFGMVHLSMMCVSFVEELMYEIIIPNIINPRKKKTKNSKRRRGKYI